MTRTGEPIDRPELLQIAGDVVRCLHEKCVQGRFKDLDVERARDSKLRILVSALGVCDNLLKNQEETTAPEGKAAIDELMDYLRNTPEEPIQVTE
jgi:predicted oxidoreductase